MNLGVFNRVNLKDNTEGKGMYSEWASLSPFIQNDNEESHSVLDKFGPGIGREVALSVVKQLASNLGITQEAEPSTLNNDREVQWCMEVICFGLTLPLSEHEAIKDCVNVYCEWLSALLPVPKICVPKPVCEDPNLYARKIISHFHNLFIPRKGEEYRGEWDFKKIVFILQDWPFLYQDLGVDTINRQAVMCHRVLRTLQQIAHESQTLTKETWEALLLFLLAINETLLSPPTVKDDVADQLCERVLTVLFEVWVIACARCFPSPPLWKTLRESCMNWRHRTALIEQWNRINLCLTARLLDFMYGPSFPELKVCEDDPIPAAMSNDCVAQSWFRFLHCIGNPVSLCRPDVISQTAKFLQFAISSGGGVMDPCQHPCLQTLPLIFLKAIKGVAGMVDAFLGLAHGRSWEGVVAVDRSRDSPPQPTPPPQRRLAKSFSVAQSSTASASSNTKGIQKASLISLTSSRVSSMQPSSITSSGPPSSGSVTSAASLNLDTRSSSPLADARPRCNSILHLFGQWLFEAAFIGHEDGFRSRLSSESGKRPSSIIVDNGSGRGSISLSSMSQPGSLGDSPEVPPSLTIDKYESGRAEAVGALCRIFCAKKTGEEILPVYSARFYLALQQGLRFAATRDAGDVLVSVLVNSPDLFRLDLDGVQVLIPSVIGALEAVLPEKDLKLKANVSRTDLRRASIHLLLSLLVLPLHYHRLQLRELSPHDSAAAPPTTVASLKPRLVNLLMNALQVESDPQNTHMLLGGLLLCVQDSSAFEMDERTVSQHLNQQCPDASDATTTGAAAAQTTSSNLLSSASDSVSMASGATLADFHSLPDEITQGVADHSAAPVDSAHALFVRATYLVCHRLISTWKSDLNVSLAALELLSGLARVQIKESDALECKRAVKWVCDYIISQCSRPPPAHSKDLHSTIVAAFQCCATWLLEHPYLLEDKECLNTVLEVAELGVSGTKSVGKPGEKVRLKDDKEPKPASMRVRDAGENLLACILEQAGYFPSECGAESLSSLLDEVALLRHCNSWPAATAAAASGSADRQLAVERFRYFVADGATMLALLEEPLGNDQDPQPTVTVLIRGPFGRHAWTLQLRHLPRHRSGTKHPQVTPNPGRPVPMKEAPPRHDPPRRYFPESADRAIPCQVDSSIPALDMVTRHDDDSTARLQKLLERQRQLEEEMEAASRPQEAPECAPPPVCHEYQTARLFLSHFGFLSWGRGCGAASPRSAANDATSSSSSSSGAAAEPAPAAARRPELVALDSSAAEFCDDLAHLDGMSPRTCDTAHVFYVRSDQRSAAAIVDNVTSRRTVSQHFLDFLLALGWPVDVAHHPGWTGCAATSWKLEQRSQPPPETPPPPPDDHGGCAFDGRERVLYWADACSEMAFVVPSRLPPEPEGGGGGGAASFSSSSEHSSWTSTDGAAASRDKPRAMSLDLDGRSGSNNPASPSALSSGSSSALRRSTARHHPQAQTNTKVLVVWLESYEDRLSFPLADLLPATSTGLETGPQRPSDCQVIFLHRLRSGLLRVHLQGPATRMNLATPLVDGMVVSPRCLGPLVRQTALNMSRRRRLDNDAYQPPHFRRRLKIQEIVQKYRREMTEPELLTYLFSQP